MPQTYNNAGRFHNVNPYLWASIMMLTMQAKRFLMLGFVLCAGCRAAAQGLNAQVELLSPQVQNTNKRALEVLQKAVSDFLKNRAWSAKLLQPEEGIDCSFVVTII